MTLHGDASRGKVALDVLDMREEMKRLRQADNASGCHVYGAGVPATRPPTDYTARVMPHRDGVAVPLEETGIV
jgi:starch phosphorylase